MHVFVVHSPQRPRNAFSIRTQQGAFYGLQYMKLLRVLWASADDAKPLLPTLAAGQHVKNRKCVWVSTFLFSL